MSRFEREAALALSVVCLVAGDVNHRQTKAAEVCDPAITAVDYEEGLRTDKPFKANVLVPKDRPGIVYVENVYTNREVFYPLVVCNQGIRAYFGRFEGRLIKIPADKARLTEVYGETGDRLSSYDPDKVAVIEQKTLRVEPPDTTPNVNPHTLGFEETEGHHFIYGQAE